MKALPVIVAIVLFGCTSRIDYFGQEPPKDKAELFAPGIISTEANEHSAIAFSPDGSIVLWSVMTRQYRGRMYEMTYSNGSWSKPTTPSFADTIADYYAPTFTVDGKTLLFNSRRPAPGLTEGRGNRIWSVERTSNGWGTPVPFDTLISKGEEFATSVTNAGTVFFSSADKSNGTSLNIFAGTLYNGQSSGAHPLPFNINTPGYEDGPYISPDSKYLIFESTRPDGIAGSHDLYITFRGDDSEWCLPINMGPKINSPGMERFPRVTPDGKYLLFASNRDQSDTRVGFDTYWIDAKVIDEIRPDDEDATDISEHAYPHMFSILQSKDSAHLLSVLETWNSFNPGNLDGLLWSAAILRKQERYEEAEKLLSVNSDNTSLAMEKALVKYGLNKNDEAAQLLEPVISNSTDLRHRYLEIANPLFDMRKFDLSDEYFEKAMAIAPNGLQFYNRACGYAHLGETSRVFSNLNKAADNGYNSKEQYNNDPDLVKIRSDKRYRALTAKLK